MTGQAEKPTTAREYLWRWMRKLTRGQVYGPSIGARIAAGEINQGEAALAAPNASSGTRRKWARIAAKRVRALAACLLFLLLGLPVQAQQHYRGGGLSTGQPPKPGDSYFDGCNTCTYQHDGRTALCTAMACFAEYVPAYPELEPPSISIDGVEHVRLHEAAIVQEAPTPVPDPNLPKPAPPVEVAIAIGPAVSVGSDAAAKPTPFAAIDTWIPVHSHFAVPVLFVEGRLTSLPGESISLSDVESWKALQFNFGASIRPVKSLGLRLYLEAGFTTRIPGDTAPRDRTARFLGGGLQVRGGRGDFRVGLYGDQRTPPGSTYGPTVGIRGRLKLYQENAEGSAVRGGAVYLFLDAILGLDYRYVRGSTSGIPVRRDVVVVGLCIGGKA